MEKNTLKVLKMLEKEDLHIERIASRLWVSIFAAKMRINALRKHWIRVRCRKYIYSVRVIPMSIMVKNWRVISNRNNKYRQIEWMPYHIYTGCWWEKLLFKLFN